MGLHIYMSYRENEEVAWSFSGDHASGVFTCAGTKLPEIVCQAILGKPFNEIVDGDARLAVLLSAATISEVAMTKDDIRISVEY